MNKDNDKDKNNDKDILNINTENINIFHVTKKFSNLLYYNKNINIHIDNIFIPFGIEKYNNKIILNIELIESNNNNNIISKIDSIENQLEKHFKNIGLIKSLKKSKLGYILRTHFMKLTECYILKKNEEKIIIDESNLQNTECEINLLIKGIWITENNYGLYIIINNIRVIKFN
jgi:hypothetical protein